MRTIKSPYDRFRESDHTSVSSETYTSYVMDGPSTVSAISGAREGLYRSMLDHVTPAYKEMSAAGLLVNSPVTSKKCTFSIVNQTGWGHQYPEAGTGGDWKGEATWGTGLWLLPLGFTPPEEQISVSSLKTAAITKALANVNKPVVQGLAFIGELQQTIDLLRHPFSALSKFFAKPVWYNKSYGRVKAGGNRHGYGYSRSWQINRNAAIGAIASQMLAFNFGVKPLLHDIEGIVEALVFRHPEILRQTARSGKVEDSSSTFSTGYAISGFLEVPYRIDVAEHVTVRAGVLYAFKGESTTSALGVRLADIPAAAWELLPWSFVLDWIANVGDIVSGLTALCTSDLLTQWVTVAREQVYTRTMTGSRTTLPWVQTIDCQDSDRCIYETYTRSPMIPGSGMGLAFNFTLNRTPTVSAISLLLQQLTKGK